MSSQPALTATLSHREGLWVRNPNLSSGSANDRWVQRVQSVEPVGTHNNTDYYQIGSVDKAGTTQDPTTYRIQFQENLHHAGTGMYLAGVDPSTGSGYNVGNLVSQTNSVYVPRRNDSDSVFEELAFGTARVTEVTYTFVNNGSCTADFTLMGTSGSYYHTAGTFPHPLWGVFDTATPGAVHGREARIAFASNAAGSKVYRVQRFVIRAQLPEQNVNELGTRDLVGTLVDTPNVTVEFDLLPADVQPHDVFFPVSNDGGVAKRALGQPQPSDLYINVYDPDQAEASSVLISFKVDNCIPTSNTPISARVRQLTTSRWSLTSRTADTNRPGSGGLIISKTELTS